MSSAGSDPIGAIVLAFLTVLALAVILPVAAAGGVIIVAGRLLVRGGRRALNGSPVQRELQRVAQERNAAIRDIVSVRNKAERELREAGSRDLIDGAAWELRP